MTETVIKAMPHQHAFLKSKAVHTGLIGGYASGKSFAGSLKTVLKKLEYPGINVAYYLPTYGLIKDVAYPVFGTACDILGLSYDLNKSDHEIITAYGKILFRSMDNPDRMVGYEVGYSLIDETDILPTNKMWDVFGRIISRNRSKLPNGDKNCTDLVGTPEGFKFAYEFFVKKDSDRKLLIKGKTKDNKHIPPDYIATLQESYTPEQLEAYLNGEFVNLTSGSVYKFDRKEHHADKQIKQGDVLHVGMDFNVTNMNAVIHIIEGDIAYAVAEISGGYDTFEIADRLKASYPGHSIVIYPDASGASRNTSGKSDHQILKGSKFTVRTKNKNPFVKDRVNALNKAFRDKKYFVNTNNCPVLTEALEQQAYKNGEPDKTTGFDHINEAAGYFAHYHFGKQKPVSYTGSY